MDTIHTSHSKKELMEVIEVFDIKIADYKALNKQNLSKQILYQLSIVDEIKEDNDFFFINNKKELLDYLINPDSSKVLSVKEKDAVMELAKYIIMYCKNGYYLSHSPFIDFDEMIVKANHIANYGDIPSVRKAIEGLNEDIKLKNKIKVIMSSRMKKKIERKKRVKQKYQGGLEVKEGIFWVHFD
tara:strand:+ start:350 stop:904 length:555 start_codon:yes stop_codon:yes gene_type:complete